MAESGRLLASVFGLLDRTPLAGKSTMEINDLVERYIVHELQARPASKGQYGYEFTLNSSVNEVVCHGVPSPAVVLREGMVFTIEPMLNQRGKSVRTEVDGWTVVTRDGALSAQFEHTVAVTAKGVSVLTLRPEEMGMIGGPISG